MFEVTLEVLALLLLAGFAAGFVDAIAGGGGLITVPVLLLTGANPVTALATNKVQGVFGAATAALSYARGGHVDLRSQIIPALISFAASIGGALLVTVLPTTLIRVILPAVLVGIAVFFATKRGLDDSDRARRMAPGIFMLTLVPLIAGYDGLLGPGTGSFFMLAFVSLGGYGILKATAHTKLLNFASNAGALLAFAVVATPWWLTGLAMGVAQIFGARLGARLAQRIGAKLIKPLLVVTSLVLATKLFWDMFQTSAASPF
ncbi:TSUP family transporter [Cognatishimia sp. SS12]|uniref:TSUP family transporter n=1 Tax=Cognatishimia sp. SS12 TaxID=2979465 RepID=UPI00232D49AF|nr:TSUP family transporter [Cognatishimia sp. SS12]MDC0737878.1 TSUP family transporter [Cognatishimia sp. SS12]